MVCSIIPRDQLASKFGFYLAYARTGELPLAIGRLKADGCEIKLSGNQDFTLSNDISAVMDATKLEFGSCSLSGAAHPSIPRAKAN